MSPGRRHFSRGVVAVYSPFRGIIPPNTSKHPARKKENTNEKDNPPARPGADVGTRHPRRHRRRLHQVANPHHSRRASDAVQRSGGTLRCRGQVPSSTGETQSSTLSSRFRPASFAGRAQRFEVPNCHLKPRRRPVWSSGVHRARRRHAFERPEKRTGRDRQCRRHAGVRRDAASPPVARLHAGPGRGDGASADRGRGKAADRPSAKRREPGPERGALRHDLQGDGRRGLPAAENLLRRTAVGRAGVRRQAGEEREEVAAPRRQLGDGGDAGHARREAEWRRGHGRHLGTPRPFLENAAARLHRGRHSAILKSVSHTEHWSMPACPLPSKNCDGERDRIVDSPNHKENRKT